MSDRSALPEQGEGERRAAARGVAWGGIESASAALVGLVLTPLVVRCSGLEGLGLWSAAWSLAHTAGLLDLGVGAAYGRFTAGALARGDLDDLNGVLAVGTGFHVTLSLLFGLPALLFGPRLLEWAAPAHPRLPEARVVVACAILTVLMRGTLSAYRGVVAGAQRADLLARLRAIFCLAEGLGGALALIGGLGLKGLALASLGIGAATSVAEGIVAHRLCPGLRLRPFRASREQYRRVLRFGSLLQLTRAFEVLAGHLPRLVLAAGPGLSAAGAYDLGARLAGGVPALASLPLRVITPLAGHLQARADRPRMEALLQKSTRYVGLLALPAVSLVLIDAEAILLGWTGQAASPEAAQAARCLAAAAGLALVASPLRLILRGLGHAGVETVSTGSGTILHLGLALFLVPRWGAAGAGVAALSGAAVALLVLALGAGRLQAAADPRVAARVLLGPVAAAAAIVIAGMLLVRAPWAGAGPPGIRLEAMLHLARQLPILGAVFVAVGASLGAIKAEDLALLREAAGGTIGGGRAR